MTSEATARDHPPTDIGTAMDAVNLERALIDFEIANARVIDLTARLTELSQDLLATRSELGLAKLHIVELELLAAELGEIKSSTAYRAARKLGDTRANARSNVAKLLRR